VRWRPHLLSEAHRWRRGSERMCGGRSSRTTCGAIGTRCIAGCTMRPRSSLAPRAPARSLWRAPSASPGTFRWTQGRPPSRMTSQRGTTR
jgi:hypothetical protein